MRCLFAATLLLTISTSAASQDRPPTISVSGNAEVLVVPDRLTLVMSVESRHEKLDEAKADNDASIQKANQFLLQQGNPHDSFRTDMISINAQFNSNRDRGWVIPEAYIVRRQFALETDQIDKFETLLQGLIERGVNRVEDLQMHTRRLREIKDKARSQAIQAAKEKATALAGQLDANLKGVVSITENTYGGSWRMNNQNYMAQNTAFADDEAASSSLAVGRIKVNAVVNVVFTLKNTEEH